MSLQALALKKVHFFVVSLHNWFQCVSVWELTTIIIHHCSEAKKHLSSADFQTVITKWLESISFDLWKQQHYRTLLHNNPMETTTMLTSRSTQFEQDFRHIWCVSDSMNDPHEILPNFIQIPENSSESGDIKRRQKAGDRERTMLQRVTTQQMTYKEIKKRLGEGKKRCHGTTKHEKKPYRRIHHKWRYAMLNVSRSFM